jgi:hypothetical protein
MYIDKVSLKKSCNLGPELTVQFPICSDAIDTLLSSYLKKCEHNLPFVRVTSFTRSFRVLLLVQRTQ